MTGEERRTKILEDIECSDEPLSGSKLAKKYEVSRQVIVQDIALLRALQKDIISTTKGYIINRQQKAQRVFKMEHSDEEMEKELNTIVDLGGEVKDVEVEHQVYGKLKAEMSIASRKDVKEFLNEIRNGESTPLKNLTHGVHFHTIQAKNERILDIIERELKEKGYLRS